MKQLLALIKEEQAQGMAEYALILIFVAIVAIAGYELFGSALNTKINDIANQI